MLLPRVLDGREEVALGERNEGVGLVVLEVHVEVGVVLRDEVALEHQGLVLIGDHQVVEARHQLHHERDLLAVVRELHVLLHAGAQVLGLAHVDDLASGVFPEVAAGIGGHAGHLLGKRGGAVRTRGAHVRGGSGSGERSNG